MAWQETQSGRELLNYPSISSTVLGWKSMLVFGALMFGVGQMCGLIALGVIDGQANAPLWVIGVVGGIFTFAGLLMMIYGWKDLRSERRRKHASHAHPKDAWRGDYDWTDASSIHGMSSRDDRLWWIPVFGIVVVLLMGTVSNWMAYEEWGEGFHSWFLAFMSVVMNLIVVLVLGIAIRRVVMRLKYGVPRIVFDCVPIHPGEQFNAKLMTRGLQHARRVVVTLREVNEEYIERQTHRGQKPKRLVKCAELRAFERVVDDVPGQLASDGTLQVKFDLPSDAKSNVLSDRPARFWDLEFRGDVRGVDFVYRFAVPVYEKTCRC